MSRRESVSICVESRAHNIVFFCPAQGEILHGTVVWQSPEDSGVVGSQGLGKDWKELWF